MHARLARAVLEHELRRGGLQGAALEGLQPGPELVERLCAGRLFGGGGGDGRRVGRERRVERPRHDGRRRRCSLAGRLRRVRNGRPQGLRGGLRFRRTTRRGLRLGESVVRRVVERHVDAGVPVEVERGGERVARGVRGGHRENLQGGRARRTRKRSNASGKKKAAREGGQVEEETPEGRTTEAAPDL